jgi:HK97 family phage major capsid protein
MPEKEEKKELTLEGVQDDVLAALSTIKNDWKGHYDELKAQGADFGEHKVAIEKKLDNAIRRIDEAEALMKNPNFTRTDQRGEIKSVGEIIAEHAAFRETYPVGGAYRKGLSCSIPIENLNIEFAPLQGGAALQTGGTFFPEQLAAVKSLVPELEQKTTITSAAVGSATSGVLLFQRVPGVVSPPQPRIRIRDIIPRLPTTLNAIDWVKENSFSEVVSPQTEASAKGESEMTFTTDTEAVRLIATWIPASRQILDDFAGLQAYLNRRLLDALMNEEDDQILRGDDTGQNLKGLSQAATAFVDATYDQTGDTVLDTLVRMMTQLEENNYSPSAFILHPRNWRIIQTIKANYGGGAGTGPYVLGGPGGISGGMVGDFAWGLPVATSSRMTVGNAFCGDFINYVVLWDRMQARVDISTEHASYFTSNLVAIRAEERVCLTVRDNNAVIYESSL